MQQIEACQRREKEHLDAFVYILNTNLKAVTSIMIYITVIKMRLSRVPLSALQEKIDSYCMHTCKIIMLRFCSKPMSVAKLQGYQHFNYLSIGTTL